VTQPSTSWHEHHSALLLALASDGPVLAALERAAERAPALGRARAWRRVFARFDAGGCSRVTLVYESGAPQALVVARLVAEAEANVPEALASLRFESFVRDPRLPTLPNVLAEARDPHVVRYRPERRCTLRDGTRFGKDFPGDEGRLLDAEARRLDGAARDGTLPFAVPRPEAWDEERRTLWQQALPGRPARPALHSARGPALARRMGRALGALSRSDVGAATRFTARDQLARSARYVAALARQVPLCASRAEDLLDALARLHERLGDATPRPIHGSPHAHQWLSEGDRLGLVDFDRYALGEPELDLATFLAELGFEDPRRCDVAGVSRAFLAGHAEVAPPPDRERLAAYRAHKVLSKALKAARAVRPDGDRRAERHLADAFACLARAQGG
jgi:aminoglycoside phosphotransferase (APT) family kinase protein